MISRKCLDKEWKVQHKWQVKELLSWRQQRFTAPPEVDDDDDDKHERICSAGELGEPIENKKFMNF